MSIQIILSLSGRFEGLVIALILIGISVLVFKLAGGYIKYYRAPNNVLNESLTLWLMIICCSVSLISGIILVNAYLAELTPFRELFESNETYRPLMMFAVFITLVLLLGLITESILRSNSTYKRYLEDGKTTHNKM